MALIITEENLGTSTVVAIGGRLDGATSAQLDERLTAAATPGARVVLDMTGLDYVSSAGLRVLLKAAKQIKAAKGRFALSGITPMVAKVFEISGFTSIFSIYADREQAAAAIA